MRSPVHPSAARRTKPSPSKHDLEADSVFEDVSFSSPGKRNGAQEAVAAIKTLSPSKAAPAKAATPSANANVSGNSRGV